MLSYYKLLVLKKPFFLICRYIIWTIFKANQKQMLKIKSPAFAKHEGLLNSDLLRFLNSKHPGERAGVTVEICLNANCHRPWMEKSKQRKVTMSF